MRDIISLFRLAARLPLFTISVRFFASFRHRGLFLRDCRAHYFSMLLSSLADIDAAIFIDITTLSYRA